MNLINNIFTWWNRQTFGTMIYTIFFGKIKGEDEFGNKYYESRSGKRWIIYYNEINASKISNEWYLWIHFLTNKIPSVEDNNKKFYWQKKRQENLTGSNDAYRPKKISENKKIEKKYEVWKN